MPCRANRVTPYRPASRSPLALVCTGAGDFVAGTSATAPLTLPPGHYLVVPSTFEPQEGRFALACLSDQPDVTLAILFSQTVVTTDADTPPPQ